MHHLLSIKYILVHYGYIGIFVIVFLESGVLFALPGDSLLFTAGLFASAFHMNIVVLIAVIFVATFLGGLSGYEIGKQWERLNNVRFFKRFSKKENLDKAHLFFEKYGKLAIIFSRFVPIVRTFIPIVAGAAMMPMKKFIRYNLIGSFLWSTIVTLLGYFLGRRFPIIKDYLSLITILIVVVSLIPFGIQYYKKQYGNKKV